MVRAERSEGSRETEREDEETGGSRAEDTCSLLEDSKVMIIGAYYLLHDLYVVYI